MVYRRRVIDDLLDEVQPHLPAVVLQGPKAVGKTATALRRATTTLRMDRADERDLLRTNRDRLVDLPGPLFIDEWQQFPPAWDYVRQAVDAGAAPGTFLLAGSALPRESPVHSGAGRLVSLRMRPMSLAERGLAVPTVGMGALLRGSVERAGGVSPVDVHDYADETVASGFPGIRELPARPRTLALAAYIDTVIQHEFPEQGLAVRRPDTLRGWLRAYAAATATTASYSTILAAATPAEPDKPARTTINTYRDVLSQLWLLDPIPAWLPQDNHFKRLASTPKHFLADPALAASLLGAGPDDLLMPGVRAPDVGSPLPLFGALFEHLVGLSVQTYAQIVDARVSHFRALDGGHEVDLIVERGRAVVAIEVKLAPDITDRDVRHLRWLRDQLGARLTAAVVITTGKAAYTLEDGVHVVPAALLGP